MEYVVKIKLENILRNAEVKTVNTRWGNIELKIARRKFRVYGQLVNAYSEEKNMFFFIGPEDDYAFAIVEYENHMDIEE